MEQLNSIISVLLMSVALSMDAFSVSLSLGMQNIRLKRVLSAGFVIGAFHIIFPFIGMMIGQYISTNITFITEMTGGFILILIGAHMVFSSLQEKSSPAFTSQGWKILLVAFLVSIDSFPAGLSFGMFTINKWYVIGCFGATAMIVSWLGMLIGKKAHIEVGTYSEIAGGILLFIIGVSIVF